MVSLKYSRLHGLSMISVCTYVDAVLFLRIAYVEWIIVSAWDRVDINAILSVSNITAQFSVDVEACLDGFKNTW